MSRGRSRNLLGPGAKNVQNLRLWQSTYVLICYRNIYIYSSVKDPILIFSPKRIPELPKRYTQSQSHPEGRGSVTLLSSACLSMTIKFGKFEKYLFMVLFPIFDREYWYEPY